MEKSDAAVVPEAPPEPPETPPVLVEAVGSPDTGTVVVTGAETGAEVGAGVEL